MCYWFDVIFEYFVWMSYQGMYFNDLLFVLVIQVVFDCFVEYVIIMQDMLDWQVLIENLLVYVVFKLDMIEIDFL